VIGGTLLLRYATVIPDAVTQLAILYPTRVLEKLHGFPPEMVVTVVKLIGQNLLVAAGILLAAAFIFAKKRGVTKTLLIGLIFFELFLFSRNNLLSVQNSVATQWLTSVLEKKEKLGAVDWRQYRIYADPSLYPYQGKKQFGVMDWDKESAWQAEILRPNLNMVAHLPAIDGYASLIYRDYAEYVNKKQADPTGVTLDDPTGVKKKRLGVGTNASPRLFLLESQDGVRIERYTPNEVRVAVVAKEADRLVFVDTNYPGWQARVDDKPSKIESYEKVFKSVSLTPGQHLVTFLFAPPSITIGAVFTLIGLGIVIGARIIVELAILVLGRAIKLPNV